MFYVLMFFGLPVRIYVTIYVMKGSLYSIVFYFLVPIAVKICVGLVQLSIIIEITLRVRESINSYRVVNSKKKLNAQKMINEVLAN